MTIHHFPHNLQSTGTTGSLVLALHCSGSVGAQWKPLRERLGAHHAVVAPDLIGTRRTGHWDGGEPFALADEAAPLIKTIDRHDGSVHLVGHSYGGGLALHIAAIRPERIASLTLYEPTAFHVLKEMGNAGSAAFAEIVQLASAIRAAAARGEFDGASERFIDYWNGEGAWRGMKPALRAQIADYIPKAGLDFAALCEEDTPSSAYARFRFPVMIMRGSASPRPALRVADYLVHRIAAAIRADLPGAGHMGPVTHPDRVADCFARHIESAPEAAFHGGSHALAHVGLR
ncbi:MAG: alpha/beta hydrolase [Pseudorhodoplanes sp.]|jgi:pimeloyl-ACP methyl ester carboxylesterase|nr:alpha/beta hydrolase [Pseudorhodoplanes sp.]